MRRNLWLLLLLLPVLTTVAQPDPAAPRYSVVVAVADAPDRLAILGADGQWTITELPDNLVYEQVDASLVTPAWSADGGTLYATGYTVPPGSDDPVQVLDVFAYTVATGDLMPVVTVPLNPATPSTYQALQIESVSPDERHALVTEGVHFRSALLDLAAGELVAWLPCHVNLIAWEPDVVLVASSGAGLGLAEPCLPFVHAVDRTTGMTARVLYKSTDPADDDFRRNFQAGRLLSGNRLLLTPDPRFAGRIALLDTGSGDLWDIGYGSDFQLSADTSRALFRADGAQMLVNFDTRTVIPVSDLFPTENALAPLRFAGNGLTLWLSEPNADRTMVAINRYYITGELGAPLTIYSGPVPLASFVAPDHESLWLLTGAEATVYPLDEPAWSSRALPAAIFDGAGEWSRSGDWLHVTPDPPDGPTISINARTGAVVTAPGDARYVSETPDGVWWLYTVTPPWSGAARGRDAALLLNPATGETVTVVEGVDLEQRNFHFRPDQYALWSAGR